MSFVLQSMTLYPESHSRRAHNCLNQRLREHTRPTLLQVGLTVGLPIKDLNHPMPMLTLSLP